MGIVDNAKNDASKVLVSVLKGEFDGEPLYNVPESEDPEQLRAEILEGDITALMVIPEGFGESGAASVIDLTFDGRKAQEAEAARAILGQVLDGVFKTVADVPSEYRVENWATVSLTEVAGRGQGYKGFVVPGIISLSIMQSALFGVVFTLVRLRNQGVLKRLHATPINPRHFLAGALFTRMLLLIMQTYVLLLVGIFVSGVEGRARLRHVLDRSNSAHLPRRHRIRLPRTRRIRHRQNRKHRRTPRQHHLITHDVSLRSLHSTLRDPRLGSRLRPMAPPHLPRRRHARNGQQRRNPLHPRHLHPRPSSLGRYQLRAGGSSV